MLTIDLSQHLNGSVPDKDLQAVTDVMLKAKKTIVVTGAGISCSSGIPDFRSADGLYNLVKKQYPKTVLKGKDLFDANLFRDCTTTAVFYTFISELHAQTLKAKPSPTHHFIKMLAEKGKLLRCYTQNIDCLEEELGMETNLVCDKGKVKKDVNVVQLHGSLRKLKCTLCSEPYGFLNDYEKVFREGEAPGCPKCELNDVIRVAQGKRKIATGTLRPDIVLYNENHPFGDAIGQIQVSDLQKSPDVLLVMGTSLKVHGLRLLVRKVAKTVHENKRGCVILVNKTPVVGKEWAGVFDYFIEGETDKWCHLVETAIRSVKVQTKLSFKVLSAEQKEQQQQQQKKVRENERKEQEQEQGHLSDKENHVPTERVSSSQKPKAMAGKKRSYASTLSRQDSISDSISAALGATRLDGSPSSTPTPSPAVFSDITTSQGRAVAPCRQRTPSSASSTAIGSTLPTTSTRSRTTSNCTPITSSNTTTSTTTTITSTPTTTLETESMEASVSTSTAEAIASSSPSPSPLSSPSSTTTPSAQASRSSPRKQNTLTDFSNGTMHVSKATIRRPVLVKASGKTDSFEHNMPELRRTRSATRAEAAC